MSGSIREATSAFVSTATRDFHDVRLPPGTSIRIIDSGIAHHHASGNYRMRRRECEEAARALKVTKLRDLTLADLSRIDALPDPLNRRARHVVTENARV